MKWILSLVLVVLVACSKQAQPVPSSHSLTSDQLFSFLQETNHFIPNNFNVVDRTYLLPTREWIEKDFSFSLQQFYASLGKTQYLPESFDCDDWSLGGMFWASVLNSNSPNRPKDAALAAGEFQYVTRNKEGHSIMLFIIFEDNQLKPIFYECQTRKIVELTAEEINSVQFFRF